MVLFMKLIRKKKMKRILIFLAAMLVLCGSCKKVQRYRPEKPVSVVLALPDSAGIEAEIAEEI